MYNKEEMKSSKYISFADGLLDLFIGVNLIVAALFIWSGLFWMVGILIPVLIPVYQAARNRYSNEQETKRGKTYDNGFNTQKSLTLSIYLGVIFLFGVAFLGIFSGFIPIDSSWFRSNILILLGIVFGTTWIVIGNLSRIHRFYLNGLITMSIFIILQWTKLPFWSALIILGGWITLVGLITFINHRK